MMIEDGICESLFYRKDDLSKFDILGYISYLSRNNDISDEEALKLITLWINALEIDIDMNEIDEMIADSIDINIPSDNIIDYSRNTIDCNKKRYRFRGRTNRVIPGVILENGMYVVVSDSEASYTVNIYDWENYVGSIDIPRGYSESMFDLREVVDLSKTATVEIEVSKYYPGYWKFDLIKLNEQYENI